MTILDELAASLSQAVTQYVKSVEVMSVQRAKEVDKVNAELAVDHTALTLRRAMTQIITELSGAPLMWPIRLDWNGLRRGLRQVLSQERYSVMIIMTIENAEMQRERIQLRKLVAELSYRIEISAGDPHPKWIQMQEKITQLDQRILLLVQERENYQVENQFLTEQLNLVQVQRDDYQHKWEDIRKKNEALYAQYLEKIRELADAHAELEALKCSKPSPTTLNNKNSHGYASFYTNR